MKQLRRDPIGLLVAADDAALRSMARRALLGETMPEINVGELPGVRRAVARQQPDGRWKYPGGNPEIRSRAAYDQMETYRQLGVLVCKFGLDHRHPAVAAAAAFLSSFQAEAGDYRGIYGHQYTPNYSAAITELLIRAGYEGSAQVENSMRWLLSMRQDDGGWAIPTRTLGLSLNVMLTARETFEPDRSRPSSHLVTGIVLRALAAHPRYRHSADTRRAAELVKSRFFRHRTGWSSPIPSGGPTCCPRSTPWPGSVSGTMTPTSPAAWPGSSTTRNPAGCGIPGGTGPRVPSAICGSGSPYAGCSAPPARDGRPCHDRSADAGFPKCRGTWDAA